MRQERERDVPDLIMLPEPEMREAREEQEWSQLNLDKQLKGKKLQAKEEVNKPSLWDA